MSHFRFLPGFGAALVVTLAVPRDVLDRSRAVVTVTTTDYAFQAPDTVQAGEVQFRLINRGPDLHHVWLFRLDAGHRAVDLIGAFRQGERMPPWAHGVGGPNVPPPGRPSIVTVRLTPGRYALLCLIKGPDGVRHLMKGMVKEMEVVGPEESDRPPKADVTITMTDYDFALSTPLRRGPRTTDLSASCSIPGMESRIWRTAW